MKRKLKYVLAGLLGLAAIGALLMLTARPPAPPALPVPNGYDDFLKAGRETGSQGPRRYGESSVAELREFVSQNRSVLALARAGLARESRVAIEYDLSPEAYAAAHLPVLAQFMQVALAFRAEGELAEREGRTNDAARVYLEGIHFGQQLCRGGLLIDRLVGIACERINLEQLRGLAPDLNAPVCRELARDLERLESGREPIQATFKQEQLWVTRTAGLRERIALQVLRLLRRRQFEAPRQNAASKVADVQRRERELMLELAAQAYELEHGEAPSRAADLAPEYLRAIPKDPATGTEMAL